MVRLAALDVGTNSTRLLVADVEGGVIVAEQAREMVITRLGKGVDRTGRFDRGALARTLEVLAGYAETCRRLGVERRRLVATSATRDAADRQVFRDAVRDLLGVEAEVLTGQAEAAAAYRGATYGLDGEQATLVVDIGGGSTELILGDGPTRQGDGLARHRLRAGLFERHLHSDPPARGRGGRAPGRRRRPPGAGRRGARPGRPPPGSSGSRALVTTVTAIALGLEAYDPRRSTGRPWTPSEIAAAAEKLAAMTVAERAAHAGDGQGPRGRDRRRGTPA